MKRATLILLAGLLLIAAWPVHAQRSFTASDYFSRGYDRNERGNLAGAIADYTRAIKLDPGYADAYFNRGNARDDHGNYAGAISDYTKYLELKPADPDAYFNRAYARFNKEDYEGSIADYTKYLEFKPLDPDAYCNRGNARDDGGDPDCALDDYNKAIELDPNDPIPYYNRAYVFREKGKLAGAVADYTKYVGMEPRDPDGYNALAWLWATAADAQFRNGKKAVQYARRAARLSKWRDPSIIDTLAAAYAEAGNFPAAVKWETKALSFRNFPRDERAEARRRLRRYRQRKTYTED